MKPETEEIIDEFLSHADELGDEIVEEIEEILGIVPFIFTILRDRPDIFTLATIADYKTSRPESLDPKTAELVTIAAAAASEANSCLKVHIGAALREGVSRDQILDTLLIAAMIGKTRILASSLRQFREICEEE